MAAVYVHHFCYALGTVQSTLADSVTSRRTFTDLGPLYDAGFRHHHMAAPSESAYDLARRAVEPLRPKLTQCGAIIYATCLPCNGNVGSEQAFHGSGDVKYLMDFPASRLQREFALDGAIILGLGQQACTSMIGSIRLAAAMLTAEPDIGSVLCVSADRFPPGARYEQTYNLISDGAGACIVSHVPAGFRFIATHQISNGALVQATDDEVVGSFFSYTHKLTSELLSKTGLQPADIDWVVSQNSNPKVWRIMSGLLGIDAAKVFAPTMDQVGHVISADNVVNLVALEQSGRLRPGDRILLPMAGFGLNWQALLLQRL
jgi:3-oxoacyl-[acyl-carrier-protein] synthase III